jgi:hypothetical protein
MAQHDYVIANGTGAAVRSDLNNALAAIVSQNSGATTPSTTYAYQWWADTTTGFLKLRNSANSAWITLFQLDGEWSTIALENGTAAAPSIYFKDSGTDTGFYSPGANQVGISTGGTARLTIDANGNVDIDSNTLYVDATNNRVGLGTSSASSLLHLSVATAASDGTKGVRISNPAGTTAIFECGSSNDSYIGTTSGSDFSIRTNNTPRIYVTNGGNVGIGATTVSDLLHLRAATTPHLRIDHTTTSSFGAVQFYEDTTQQAAIGALGSTSSGTGGGNALQIWNFLNAPTLFATNNQERARIDSSGRLLVGTSSAFDSVALGTDFSLGIERANYVGIALKSNIANAVPSYLAFNKSRGTTLNSKTIVANNDELGAIVFGGADGTNMVTAAAIVANVDGTPGTNDMPGRLVFSTTADGASSPTERGRINSSGATKFSTSGSYRGSSTAYHEFTQGNQSDICLVTYASNASYNSEVQRMQTARAASSLFSFLLCDNNVNVSGDTEFNLRGDGNGYCDGSWAGGGADYAEYFEWSDGNPDQEDRRGISVVLDGNQIRPTVDGEEPIGVISGNPSVVGDAAWNKWSGKYLRDDYGTYIQEDYEVVNNEGETVIQQRRKLNPAYDPDQEYVNREQRPEWDCVGLMGKLRIRKGQPTGSRWIKMRDISDSVEEWLVR